VTPFDLPGWLVLLWLFVLGAVLGSFLNVCIYRIPRHEKFLDQLRGLWSPPSSCPRCGHRIPRRDNVPIVGWLVLGGRCRSCRARISIRYPAIELFNGLLFVVVYWFVVPLEWGATIRDSAVHADFGLRYAFEWSDVAVLHWRYFYLMVLLEALVVATFIDFDRMIIPDGATLPAMAVGVAVGAAVPQVHLVPLWFQGWVGLSVPEWFSRFPHLHGLLVSLAGPPC
jgi:leader peptidase (prepilin peptidase) / N-methyltransferase